MISVKFCTEVKGWLWYKWRSNIAESLNSLSRTHGRYRRQTDDRRICDSKEPERHVVTFGKKVPAYRLVQFITCLLTAQDRD